MSKKMMFEVLYGPINTPMDEWDVQYTFNYDPEKSKATSHYGDNVAPEMIQEYYVRRNNWDLNYRHKLDPESYPLTHHWMMRQVPEEMDYKARAEKLGWVIWKDYTHQAYRMTRLSDDKTEVTFYSSEKDARLDRAKTMPTPRYLRTVLGYDEDDIAAICRRQGIPYACEWELKFATTREEIRHVYVHGPRSCMSGENDMAHYGFHPTEVYACAPIAVAYLVSKTDPSHISGRAVVNMDKKGWIEIYGARSQMRMLLEQQGYAYNRYALQGERLLRLKSTTETYPNTYPMPYADYYYDRHNVSTCEKYWLVDIEPEDDERRHAVSAVSAVSDQIIEDAAFLNELTNIDIQF